MMILSFMINHLFTYRLSFVSLHSLAKYDMIVEAVDDLVKINIDKVKLSKCLAQTRQGLDVFVFIVESIPGIYNDVHLLSIYLFCCTDFSKWRIYWVFGRVPLN